MCKALGYDGEEERQFVREAFKTIRLAGARLYIFEETVAEIRGILDAILREYGTAASYSSGTFARNFLRTGVSRGDILKEAHRLEHVIKALGITIIQTPERVERYVRDELSLGKRLSAEDGITDSPRIRHDVNAIAGVVTLRKGAVASGLSTCKALFVTTQERTIRSVNDWWRFNERESCVSPIIHLCDIANYAWLRDTRQQSSFHRSSIVATCAAGMKASDGVWRKFYYHLEDLKNDQMISDDEVLAIMASTDLESVLSEHERNGEFDNGNEREAFSEVIQAVISSYSEESVRVAIREASRQFDHEREELNQKLLEAQEALEIQKTKQSEIVMEEKALREAMSTKIAKWVLIGFAVICLAILVPLFIFLSQDGSFNNAAIASLVVGVLGVIVALILSYEKIMNVFKEKVEDFLCR